MSYLEAHHDLSLMLLVGRSLEDGIPWTVEEDQAHIARERVLWDFMTDDERRWEQEFLESLWRAREEERAYPINHGWGEWMTGLPKRVRITDTAFGLPKNAYRPRPRARLTHLPGTPVPLTGSGRRASRLSTWGHWGSA